MINWVILVFVARDISSTIKIDIYIRNMCINFVSEASAVSTYYFVILANYTISCGIVIVKFSLRSLLRATG